MKQGREVKRKKILGQRPGDAEGTTYVFGEDEATITFPTILQIFD